MASFSWRWVGQVGRRGGGCLALVGFAACGGQAVGEDPTALGGGGQTSTATPANGATTSTSTTTEPPLCLGMPPQTSIGSTCTARLPLDPIPASNANCVFKLPIASNYRLNPDMVRFYFPTSNGGSTEIPYVGTLDGCASATTYGGWYATNVAGGDSDVGYCPCTCNAAHKYSITVDISCDGIPK